jgi:hypothetical protein
LAIGAEVVAATGTRYNDLGEAIRRVVDGGRTFEPDPLRIATYDRLFAAFCKELRKRGYV